MQHPENTVGVMFTYFYKNSYKLIIKFVLLFVIKKIKITKVVLR